MPIRQHFVKPEIALRQLDAENPSSSSTSGAAAIVNGETPAAANAGDSAAQQNAQPGKPTRFYGSVKLDPARLNRDAVQVSTEVLQHLTSLLNAHVQVTLEIQARVDGGIPDNIARTVSENCKTLKFQNQAFEKE